jgi:hypothetical protein
MRERVVRPGRSLAALMLGMTVAVVGAAPATAVPSWLAPVTLSAPTATQSEGADVAGDPAGDAMAVWVRDGVVQAATHAAGGGWSPARDLSTAGRTASAPQVAMDAAGDALVVWVETSPNGAVIRRRTRPAGGDFSASAPLSEAETGHDASSPRIAMNASGAAAVVWLRKGDTYLVIEGSARDTVDAQFALPTALAGPNRAGDALDPHVAIDAAGDMLAVWTLNSAASFVESAARPAGGLWADRQLVSAAPSNATPDVALDASGRAYAVWHSDPPGPLDDLSGAARGTSPGFAAAAWAEPSTVALSVVRTPRVFFDAAGARVLLYEVQGLGFPQLYGNLGDTPASGVQLSGFNYPFQPSSGLAVGPTGTMVYLTGGAGWQTRWRSNGGSFGQLQDVVPGGAAVFGRLGVALDGQGNGVGAWQEKIGGNYVIRAAGYDAAAPTITGVSIPDRVPVGTPAAMSATATDRWSGVSFSWEFNDGGVADGDAVTHAFATSGIAEVTLTARDASGNATTTSRSLQVIAAPPVIRDPDVDGDGIRASQDCDDANPHIRPGTPEVPGNKIDENCDGRADPYPLVTASALLTTDFLANRSTRLRSLIVRDVSSGDSIQLKCSGQGCPRSINRTIKVRKARRLLDLSRYIEHTRLRPGARLEVRISHAQRVTRIFTWIMRTTSNGAPKRERSCQAPGSKRATRC